MIKAAANPGSLKSPTDTVSDMQFIMTPKNQLLLGCCSWDGMVMIYEVDQNVVAKPTFEYKSKDKVAYLRFCFAPDGSSCFVATSSHQIIQINISTKAETVIGSHNDRIVGLRYMSSVNQLVSCSVDKTIQLWDIAGKKSVKSYSLTQKPTYMDCSENMIAVTVVNPSSVLIGTSKLDQFGGLNARREGIPTCVAISEGNGAYYYLAGYTYGDVEIGTSSQPEALVIDTHRNDPASTAYCVNAVSIYQGMGASCGTDGKVYLFDFSQGKSVQTIDIGKGKPVVAVALPPVPNIIAAATGNDWSKGSNDKGKYSEQVIVQKF